MKEISGDRNTFIQASLCEMSIALCCLGKRMVTNQKAHFKSLCLFIAIFIKIRSLSYKNKSVSTKNDTDLIYEKNN